MSVRSVIIRFTLFLMLIKLGFSDVYVDEIRKKCFGSKILIYCGHYRFMKYITGKYFSDAEELDEKSFANVSAQEPIKLVKLNREPIDMNNYLETRQLNDEPEITKLIKFLTRQTLTYMNTNGLIIRLPDGSDIVEMKNGTDVDLDKAREAKGKRQKKLLIIPILLLFKMFKVKVLLAMVLGGILFIKKVMLAVALLLPALFASLKSHCKSEDKVHYYHANDRYYYSDPSENGYSWFNDYPYKREYTYLDETA